MKKTKLILAISLMSSAMAAHAFEETSTTYPASGCKIALDTSLDNEHHAYEIQKYTGVLKHKVYTSGFYDDLDIICPVPISDEENLNVNVSVKVKNANPQVGYKVACELVSTSPSDPFGAFNPHTSASIGLTNNGALDLNHNFQGADHSVSLACALPDGASIASYKVTQKEGAIMGNQSPWSENNSGNLTTGTAWNYTMGYHFTSNADGLVTGLGGLFDGTKTVSLYNKSTGDLLASTEVTSTNEFAYSSISPVAVDAGVTYTVAVTLGGTGGSYQNGLSANFPQDFGNITIEGSTYISGTGRPTNNITTTMYGQADIQFWAN
jgi:hypothetical protein